MVVGRYRKKLLVVKINLTKSMLLQIIKMLKINYYLSNIFKVYL